MIKMTTKALSLMHVPLMCNMSNHVGLFLTLLRHIAEHPVQFGTLLVHLFQTFLGILLLGLQVLQAGALPVQIILHVLKPNTNTHTNTHEYTMYAEMNSLRIKIVSNKCTLLFTSCFV